MYTRNNTGPNTDSCGTPDVTGRELDLVPLIITDCDLLHKKSWIQSSR